MPADNHEKNIPTPTTLRLMKMLESSPKRFLEQYFPVIKNTTFHSHLRTLMSKRNITSSELIRRADISKTYVYQCLNGERLPGRDIALRMAFILKLDVKETQRFLTLAQKSVLYPKRRRDAAILFCIQKKFLLDETNSFLKDLGEKDLL